MALSLHTRHPGKSVHDWHSEEAFLKKPEPQDRQTVEFVQNVQPVSGMEQVWHCEEEFKKYIDLHYKHKELVVQMEHPSMASEQSKHCGVALAVGFS